MILVAKFRHDCTELADKERRQIEDFNFGSTGLFVVGGGVSAVIGQTSTHFSATVNNAGTMNLYETGGGVVTIQNNFNADTPIRIVSIRTRVGG